MTALPSGGRPTTAPSHIEIRPRRLRATCYVSAAVSLAASVVAAVAIGLAPPGAVDFGPRDQAGVVLAGLLAAAGMLWFTRPRVAADAARISVRNMAGTTTVPWQVVRGVRFTDRTSWAVLELADDDTLPMMAVQRADGVRAATAVAELRAMVAAYGG